MGRDDKLIAISEDDDTVVPSGLKEYHIDESVISQAKICEAVPEHTLILGWNEHTSIIINEIDNYVVSGSSMTVVANYENGKDELERRCSRSIKNQTLQYVYADTTDRQVLDDLMQKHFDHVIILCYTHLGVQEADAQTLITLLHLRDICEKTGQHFSIVSEMRDVKNKSLAEIARVNDFIVSDKLLSLLITQISENKLLTPVFEDLFDPDGSEVYVKSIENYIKAGEPVNFYTIVESASRKNEVALDYKIASEINEADKGYGIYVNPQKSSTITFSNGDALIVLAEE